MAEPPVARYRLTLSIVGNTLNEIEDELLAQTRGGFLVASGFGNRDSWHSAAGRVQSVMEHRNPDMTPERYAAELDAWFTARRAERKPKRRRDPQTPHLHPESVPGCFRCDLREEESRG